MRKITKVVYCDRCKVKLSESEYRHSITLCLADNKVKMESLDEFLDNKNIYCSDVKDFCADCTKSFYEWIKEGVKTE